MALAGCSDTSDGGTTEPGEDETTEPEDGGAEETENLPVPNTAFNFDYEEGETLDEKGEPWDGAEHDGRLTITHHGGDAVKANELSIRGTSVTISGDGHWADQAGGGTDDGLVSAGYWSAIEVNADSKVQVVYEYPEYNESRILTEWSGPDA